MTFDASDSHCTKNVRNTLNIKTKQQFITPVILATFTEYFHYDTHFIIISCDVTKITKFLWVITICNIHGFPKALSFFFSPIGIWSVFTGCVSNYIKLEMKTASPISMKSPLYICLIYGSL